MALVPIAVLGAAESGVGAAVLAKAKGFDVFLSDKGKVKEQYRKILDEHSISWEEGMHSEERILSASEIIKSPGIPDNAPLIVKARNKGIPVISEIEFAGRYTNAFKVCITGSNGKTTTTLLTYHILKKAGLHVGLAGNVGKSLAMQVATQQHDFYVIELSSFQLDGMYDFRADIAILLNITPDHLDRYDYQPEKYAESKFRVARNLTGKETFIYCADDPVTVEMMKEKNIPAQQFPFSILKKVEKGACLEENQIVININPSNPFTMSIFDLALQGKHNIYNSMAAGVAAYVLNIRKDVIRESLADFQNVEHRLEYVSSVCGIDFINDSKATNVNSVWFALESMTKPVVWIAGGVDKGNDYSMLHDLVKEKVKGIVCLGKDNKKLFKAFGNMGKEMSEAATAVEAVKKAYYMAKKGDVVLLSPACASFDIFENYEDRGRQFKNAVRSL